MPGRFRDRFDARALAILATSLLATLAAWWSVQSQGRELQQARFQAAANEAIAEIGDRMATYEQALLGARALFDASMVVERGEWSRFVRGLDIGSRYPGVQGLGFALRVAPELLAEHERAIRQEGLADYAVSPPGMREAYFPVIYLEPSTGLNRQVFGYDMFAEAMRQTAMIRARDYNRPAMSGKLALVQEPVQAPQAGALLYVPVYAREADLATIESRRAALRGYVFSSFRMDDLFHAILGKRLDTLCITIDDQGDGPTGTLFSNQPCDAGQFAERRTLDVFGRDWIVRIRSTPPMDHHLGEGFFSQVVLLAGIIISVLLVLATQSMVAERRRREALAAANLQLDAARRQAEAANAAKSRFLAAASHDLRQPLQALGIYLHMLSERSDAELHPIGAEAMRSFETTQRLLSSLLDIAAMESGDQRMQQVPVDVAAILTHLADQVRPLAQSRGLVLRLRTCPVSIVTDPVMLERLLRNLIDNALKYTPSGAILLSCRTNATSIRIKIADSGPGIPPDKRELIFEDFYQLTNPERDRSKGLGLGLATVSRLARLLGCRLELYSRLGKGSAFVVVMGRPPPQG